ADRSIDDVGVILTGCDPEIEGVDYSPLRPVGGNGETDRVSVHPGAPQTFSLASCPQFHRDVHLLTVHPGTRKCAGLKAVASPDFKLGQEFRLIASGRDATSEEATLRLTKEREEISIEEV
ncbi:hypothetical protein N9C08_01915, partial [Rubripirellula sp.]|nr:hypothetical protein [Rubripirellula sp.]